MNDIYRIILSLTNLEDHYVLLQVCKTFKEIILSFYVPIYEVLLKACLNNNFSDITYFNDTLNYTTHKFIIYCHDVLSMAIENENYIICKYLIKKLNVKYNSCNDKVVFDRYCYQKNEISINYIKIFILLNESFGKIDECPLEFYCPLYDYSKDMCENFIKKFNIRPFNFSYLYFKDKIFAKSLIDYIECSKDEKIYLHALFDHDYIKMSIIKTPSETSFVKDIIIEIVYASNDKVLMDFIDKKFNLVTDLTYDPLNAPYGREYYIHEQLYGAIRAHNFEVAKYCLYFTNTNYFLRKAYNENFKELIDYIFANIEPRDVPMIFLLEKNEIERFNYFSDKIDKIELIIQTIESRPRIILLPLLYHEKYIYLVSECDVLYYYYYYRNNDRTCIYKSKKYIFDILNHPKISDRDCEETFKLCVKDNDCCFAFELVKRNRINKKLLMDYIEKFQDSECKELMREFIF